MSEKAIRKADLQAYIDESQGLERDFISEVLKSRKTAWKVAIASGGIAVMGICAGIVGLSQKAPAPLVFRVDNATGNVEQITTMEEQESYSEVVDQYWLNQYVLNRESYDYNTIQLTYDTTALLSAAPVQKEFAEIYNGQTGLHVKVADRYRIVVSIRSIQPQGSTSGGQSTATIRFSTQRIYRDGHSDQAQNMIATVSYKYVNVPMSLRDRRINPLGFQVTSYRADPETVR